MEEGPQSRTSQLVDYQMKYLVVTYWFFGPGLLVHILQFTNICVEL